MGEKFTDQIEQPRIYVACLAAYNNSIFHGAWVDAAHGAWALWDEVQMMLAASPIPDAEEWTIHHYEGFGRVHITEYASLETVAELTGFILENGALGAAVLHHCDDNVEEAREALSDRYLGCHATLADYMQEVTEDAANVPHALRYYIDWQATARDAEISGDLFTVQVRWDELHVFAGH